MAATTRRTNTPTEQNKEDNKLVLYRLELVEQAVKDVGFKLDSRENLKRSDIIEFKDAVFERFAEVKASLEKQLDEKAEQSQVDDLRGLVKWGGAFFTSVIGGLVVFYLTRS